MGRKEPMSGDECGEFVSLGLGLLVVAVGAGLCAAVPWLAGVVGIGLVVWLVWGWIRDEREYRARS